MLTAIVLIVTHLVAAGAGAFGWLHLSPLVTKFQTSRAVKDAQKLVTDAESAAQKLEAAKKLLASQLKPTGTTGPTGA